jgi:hypothetical protein
LLFAQIPQCLDATCYHAKLTEHVNRQVAARPELVQIETAHRNRRKGGPVRSHATSTPKFPAPRMRTKAPNLLRPCESSKTAIVVYGEGAGGTRTVCTDPGICGTGWCGPQSQSPIPLKDLVDTMRFTKAQGRGVGNAGLAPIRILGIRGQHEEV